MAEIELRVFTTQCLDRRIDTITEVRSEVAAWEKGRNNKDAQINGGFTTEKARIKLLRFYTTIKA